MKNIWTYTSTLTYIRQGMILGYAKGQLNLYLYRFLSGEQNIFLP